jgi:AAA15 family ATPase/GTPase
MITKIRIKNFRQICDQTIELAPSVVIVGPNNGGKTTFLQAISLFSIALRAWGSEHVNKKSKAFKRAGVAINLEEIINIPISEFKELWTDLNVRAGEKNKDGKPITKNIRIEIHAEGNTDDKHWKTGFEFDYGRDSLMYVRLTNDEQGNPYNFPDILVNEKIGYLPSVAGLKPVEDKLEVGSILRHIGNGNTSDVLRNICFLLYEKEDKRKWEEFVAQIEELFKITLNPPQYIPLTGLLKMTYNEGNKKQVDLASIGSGTKQAILLFAYILAFPNTVNLLDEPDAHLEVIRQQNIYDKISNIAKKNNSQIIVASHSESVLNRAFGKDLIVSSVFGKFEIINRDKYIKSILRDYGYEQLIIAKQRPRIFYFEGITDLDFIKAFAVKLNKKELIQLIDNNVYPYPIDGNNRARMNNHFSILKKFVPELKAFALFDHMKEKQECSSQKDLLIKEWTRNEIENYIPLPQTLNEYIDTTIWPIYQDALKDIVKENTPPAAYKNLNDNFWKTTKISDDFLTPIFEKGLDSIALPRNKMEKSKFYQLVDYIDPKLLDNEVVQTLDAMLNHLK